MADHGKVEYGVAAGNDLTTHEATYKTFLGLVKWNIIVIAIILILMAYFLT